MNTYYTGHIADGTYRDARMLANILSRITGQGSRHVTIRLNDGSSVRGELAAVDVATGNIDMNDVERVRVRTPHPHPFAQINVANVTSVRTMPHRTCHICRYW